MTNKFVLWLFVFALISRFGYSVPTQLPPVNSSPEKTFKIAGAEINRLDWSPTGKQAAYATNKGLFLLNLDVDPQPQRINTEYLELYAVAFSPDGRTFATGGADSKVKLWDAVTGSLMQVVGGHFASVTSVAFNVAGTRIVSGGDDGHVMGWDLQSKKQIFDYSARRVKEARFSTKGDYVAAASDDGALRIWPTVFTKDEPFKVFKHAGIAKSVSFTPDGLNLIGGYQDGWIRIWTIVDGKVQEYVAHDSGIASVVVSNDGQLMASIGEKQRVIKFWKLIGEAVVSLAKQAPTESSKTISLRSDRQQIMVGSEGGLVEIFDVVKLVQAGGLNASQVTLIPALSTPVIAQGQSSTATAQPLMREPATSLDKVPMTLPPYAAFIAPLEITRVYSGTLTNIAYQYYTYAAKQGERLTLIATGGGVVDWKPHISVFKPDGSLLQRVERLENTVQLAVEIPADGIYSIMLVGVGSGGASDNTIVGYSIAYITRTPGTPLPISGTAIPTVKTAAASSSSAGKIVYAQQNKLLVVDAATRTTTGVNFRDDQDAIYAQPAWSPDGKQIVFARRTTKAGSDIYIVNADGSGLRRITNNGNAVISQRGNYNPIWSPDGRFILFNFENSQDVPSEGVYLIKPDATSRVRLNQPAPCRFSAWSPDSSQILCATSKTAQAMSSLYLLGMSKPSESKIYQAPQSQIITNAAWSPDGKQIGFISKNEIPTASSDTRQFGAFSVVNSDGSNVRAFSRDASGSQDNLLAAAFAWSPDGQSVAVITTDGLYSLSVADAKITLLQKIDGGDIGVASWHR